MNIKSVSEKTGLTKKAIKYYESEGLINPSKNADNNYREYTDDDVVKLNLIGALRAVDIPVNEIKCLVEGNKNLQNIMSETLNKINSTISNLEKSKLVITNILDKNLKDSFNIAEQVRRLRETLELSVSEKNELISNTLLRIFPGNFGKLFVSNYEPFLNINIDTEEKKNAWLKLVEFLDDLDEADSNHPFIKNMSNMDINKIELHRQQVNEYVSNFLNDNKSAKENYVKSLVKFIKSLNENEELRKTFAKSVGNAKDLINDIGNDTDIFDIYLEVLNEDYKKFREITKQLNEDASKEIKKEFGVTMEEFCKGL